MLRETPNNETVIVEYGFVDSKGDDVSQLKNNWQNLAEAVVKAVSEYIGVPYNEQTNSENYYRVKNGDTLYSIARKYNLTVDELKNLNNLSNNTLSIGQKLYVSQELPNTEVTYTVVKGDTLYNIANRFRVSVDNLKLLNNLTSNTLSIGQVLKIPNSTIVQDLSKFTYTVKSGDTLYNIARVYNTDVDTIKRLNNLVGNNLSIGQTLILPRR